MGGMGMSANGPQLDAWRAVVTSHAAVTDRIQKALAAADLPPLSWFEVLSAVKSSPTGRPRMSELAEWLTLSRGGITKLVDRLEEARYLQRGSRAEDPRGAQAPATPGGGGPLGVPPLPPARDSPPRPRGVAGRGGGCAAGALLGDARHALPPPAGARGPGPARLCARAWPRPRALRRRPPWRGGARARP